jgi:hypothetical protein
VDHAPVAGAIGRVVEVERLALAHEPAAVKARLAVRLLEQGRPDLLVAVSVAPGH